jgi:hypothetical protein
MVSERFVVCGACSSLLLHSSGTKSNPRAKTSKKQKRKTTPKTALVLESELLKSAMIQTTKIQTNKNVKAVAGCPLANNPMNISIATKIQNIGDSGSLDKFKLKLLFTICTHYSPQGDTCQSH